MPHCPKQYGLIDSIHWAIVQGSWTDGGNSQSDPQFNALVKRITGFSNIEAPRQQYLRDIKNGAWIFDSFARYTDNYLTENLPGVKNPTYPALRR